MTADIDLDPCLPGRQVFTTAVIAPDLSDMADEIFDGNAFNGVFDGADRKIYNLTIDTNGLGKDYLGFFGEIHKSGEIKNLGIENVRLSGTRSEFPVNSTYCAGGLAGNNNGNISRCYSTGSIAEGNDSGNIGGLVGKNSGIIYDCCSAASVIVGDYGLYVGGLVGWNAGAVYNCFSSGNVNNGFSSGGGRIGGIAGGNFGLIKYCFSTGYVNAGYSIHGAGCLAGGNGGTINNCYSSGSVDVGNSAAWIGNLAGANGGEIKNCFSTGSVYGYISSELGGIVGENTVGRVKNCYSTSVIIGDISWLIGGLIGYHAGGDINYCYSKGLVSGISSVGGLMGWGVASNINSSYFLDAAGPNNGYGAPLADTQMKQQNSFIGWDFVGETINGVNDVWTIDGEANYPKLVWPMVNLVSSRFPFGWYEVDFADFAAMANWWGYENCSDNNDCNGADFDFSNTISIHDLEIFCNYWLEGRNFCNHNGYCEVGELNCSDCECNIDGHCDQWEKPDCIDCTCGNGICDPGEEGQCVDDCP